MDTQYLILLYYIQADFQYRLMVFWPYVELLYVLSQLISV